MLECTSQAKPKIAIVGIFGRFPGGANSCEAFWDLLREGLDVHEEVPPLHWSKAHVDATGARKNSSATPYGCWLNDPASFDARFFNISPREAPQIDPAQRIALMTAYSITRPHTGAQRAIFSKILNSSAVDTGSVGYVEMHGTGTQAGDATEMSSVLEVFAPQDRPARQDPVFLGSAKSNIGTAGQLQVCRV